MSHSDNIASYRTCRSCDGVGADCWRCKGSGEAIFCALCGEPNVGDEHCRCLHCGSETECDCEASDLKLKGIQ